MRETLIRDPQSSAVIAVDIEALQAYKLNRTIRQRALTLEARLNSMTTRVEVL